MPLFCLVFNCPNKKSKRKDLTFCRVPKIIKNQGEETEILSAERRRRWLTAISVISRDNLTNKILDYDLVCGEHFHCGKEAHLFCGISGTSIGYHRKQNQEKARRQLNVERAWSRKMVK